MKRLMVQTNLSYMLGFCSLLMINLVWAIDTNAQTLSQQDLSQHDSFQNNLFQKNLSQNNLSEQNTELNNSEKYHFDNDLSIAESMSPIDQFFSQAENERLFRQAQGEGKIEFIRQNLKPLCLAKQLKSDKDNIDPICACYQSAIDALTDREVYFESMNAFLYYQKMQEAIERGSRNDYLRFKKLKDEKTLLSSQILQQCNAIGQ